MDDTDKPEMGNKVTGSSKEEVTQSKSADPDHAALAEVSEEPVRAPSVPLETDPDFAEELAELERSEDVPGTADASPCDGDAEMDLNLLLDSDTESKSQSSKKSSQSTKPADNMEDVSSDDDDFQKREKRNSRLSTESITSMDEEVARGEEKRPGTPCLDEKRPVPVSIPSGCEPLSDTDRDSEAGESSPVKKEEFHGPRGVKLHIRSMEEELDDIESDEESFNDPELWERKKKENEEESSKEKEDKDPPIEDSIKKSVPVEEETAPKVIIPEGVEDPAAEVGLIEGEDLMDIDEILGDREILSESSDKSVVEEQTGKPDEEKEESKVDPKTDSVPEKPSEEVQETLPPVEQPSTKESLPSNQPETDDIQIIDDSDDELEQQKTPSVIPTEKDKTSEPPPKEATKQKIVDERAGGDAQKETEKQPEKKKEKRFMTLNPPIDDMDVVEIIDDDDCLSDAQEEKPKEIELKAVPEESSQKDSSMDTDAVHKDITAEPKDPSIEAKIAEESKVEANKEAPNEDPKEGSSDSPMEVDAELGNDPQPAEEGEADHHPEDSFCEESMLRIESVVTAEHDFDENPLEGEEEEDPNEEDEEKLLAEDPQEETPNEQRQPETEKDIEETVRDILNESVEKLLSEIGSGEIDQKAEADQTDKEEASIGTQTLEQTEKEEDPPKEVDETLPPVPSPSKPLQLSPSKPFDLFDHLKSLTSDDRPMELNIECGAAAVEAGEILSDDDPIPEMNLHLDEDDLLDDEDDKPGEANPISLDDYFSDSNDAAAARKPSSSSSAKPPEKTTTATSPISDSTTGQVFEDSNSSSSTSRFNSVAGYEGDSEEDDEGNKMSRSKTRSQAKPKEVKKYAGECINPDCRKANITDMFPAPAFARSFFKLKDSMNRVKVCNVCLDDCIEKYGSLWDKFEHLSLDYSDIPQQTELEVIASSSDEEGEHKQVAKQKEDQTAAADEEDVGTKKLSAEIGDFLEENLEQLLEEMRGKFSFADKVLEFETNCEKKLDQQTIELATMFGELKGMMRKVDGYYQKMTEVVHPIHPTLEKTLRSPPRKHVPELVPGSICFAQWKPGYYRRGIVLKYATDSNQNPMYEVRFEDFEGHRNVIRALPSDQVAHQRLQKDDMIMFGSRVIACEDDKGWAGMVGDVLQQRLLIFFEDGQTRYVDKKFIRLSLAHFPAVHHASIVLEKHSKPLIKDLFASALTKEFRLAVEDIVELYFSSRWTRAMVLSVDGPVLVCGSRDKRRMIYAGSPYIRPVKDCHMVTKRIKLYGPNVAISTEKYVSPYNQQDQENAAKEFAQEQRQSLVSKRRQSIAVEVGSSSSAAQAENLRRVQPVRGVQLAEQKKKQKQRAEEEKEKRKQQAAQERQNQIMQQQQQHQQEQQERTRRSLERAQEQHQQQQNSELRQVAKKSGSGVSPSVERTSRPRQAVVTPMPSQYYRHVKNMNNATIYLDEDDDKQGQIMSFVAPKKFSKSFVTHHCTPRCTPVVHSDLAKYNPLSQPLMAGWKRRIVTTSTKQKSVLYKAPCGRSLRNMYEVHHYLRESQSPFNVDLFEFEVEVSCLSEYRVDQKSIKWQSLDLSEGQEPMPVSSVNYYDQSLPPSCLYSTERTPTEGVNLNLDEEFLACCDCEDDCLDKSKCQCWQLTIQGERMRDPEIYENDVGYVYKRLPNPVPTGIYECNPRCRCSKSCLNRVVQHKIQLKLQVYKTANRGWGIRCLNDVPKGGFICVYAGNLLTEQKANEEGANLGDEYFAELDYIEVAERLKQGYESDVGDWSDWDSSSSTSEDDDRGGDFQTNDYYKNKTGRSHLQRKRSSRQTNSAVPKKKPKPQPLRKFFGANEEIYVMDAKITGNIGRYFNHSCAPNLFVQNVFVDTHDLRFPWVSFFAMHNIRAGSELTWNYNYEVGSVQGKILICQCGAETCRGRIL